MASGEILFNESPVPHMSCRHVTLPRDLAAVVPKDRLMSEAEWRKLGVQQSRGWVHYMLHRPGEHLNFIFIFACYGPFLCYSSHAQSPTFCCSGGQKPLLPNLH